jgi:hypothetical protein
VVLDVPTLGGMANRQTCCWILLVASQDAHTRAVVVNA